MTWSPDGTRVEGFGSRDPGAQDIATTLSLFDTLGSAPPIVVVVDSPFWSSSWQRLAQ